MTTEPLLTVAVQEDGALVAMLSPDAPEGCSIRYCFPWDGPRLLFIQGEYLAPVYCDPATVVRFRLFCGRKGISEVLERKTQGDAPEHPTPTVLIPRTQNRDFRAYDWGMRHRAVCELVRSRRPNLLLIGDSITHFWGGEPVDPNHYPDAEVDPMGWNRLFASYRTVNLGFGNDRIENVLWRVLHGELDGANPHALCVLLIGTNNLSENNDEEIVVGIKQIISAILAKLPQSRILIQGLYPREGAGNERIPALNHMISELVAQLQTQEAFSTSLRFADPGLRLLDSAGNLISGATRDGLHPTQSGYELIAQELIPAIESFLA